MSDWVMPPRNIVEQALHTAGYRVIYSYTCMYTVFPPAGAKTPPGGWLYYGKSQDDAWTAAYQHNQRRGDVPKGLLDILNTLVDLHERDEYPSVEFAFKLTELRDWLKREEYRS